MLEKVKLNPGRLYFFCVLSECQWTHGEPPSALLIKACTFKECRFFQEVVFALYYSCKQRKWENQNGRQQGFVMSEENPREGCLSGL